ncbi:Alpha/Beta hydrolase protein [Mycena sanguinolenta]|nr:Alpha/Beta hydrolase protein [Mycena sanguinolenta]
MTTAKPTIIIIPGSFSSLRFYEAVTSELESHGYPVLGIELETVGVRSKAPGLYDDAAKVAALTSQLAEEGKDVVLVPHSYGGLVACESAKGLAQSVREKEGKKGGIVRIVFVTSVVGLEGQSLTDIWAESEVKLDYIRVEVRYFVARFADMHAVVFNDLSPEDGLSYASQMPNHSAISFAQKLTYAAYKDIPVSYLFCERDNCITPKHQTQIIAAMESQMGGKTVDRHSVPADHGIPVSQPKTMVAFIRKALGDAV